MDEEEIQYLTACKILYFWQVCDILRQEGVLESSTWTFPVMLLMTFMRLRQGLPFQMLEILFENKGCQGMHDRFWQVAIIYFSRANPIPKMFSDKNCSEEEINQLFDDLTSN